MPKFLFGRREDRSAHSQAASSGDIGQESSESAPSKEEAKALQLAARRWGELARQQQEVAHLLRVIAVRQRRILSQWEVLDKSVAQSDTSQLEEDLQSVTLRALQLESSALDHASVELRSAADILRRGTQNHQA